MPFTKHREGNKYILYKSSLTPLLGTSKQFPESCLKKGLIRDQRTNCLHSCLLNEHNFLTNLCKGELRTKQYCVSSQEGMCIHANKTTREDPYLHELDLVTTGISAGGPIL